MKIFRPLALAAIVTTAVLATPPAAQAEPSGADYGQHVRVCAQTMGLSGDHNPGMHQGYAGWNGMTCHA